jgi:hypothetical protein
MHSIQDFNALVKVFGYVQLSTPKASRGPAVTSAWFYWALNYRVLKIFSQPLRGLLLYGGVESG